MSSLLSKDQLWNSNGVPKTRSLFSETCIQGDVPLMTLNGGRADLPCLRDFYVPLVAADPSEYTFAEAVFGDVRFWLALKKVKWIQSYLDEWNQMADIKRKSDAFVAMIDEIKSNGRSRFTAAKYLIEEPWKDKRNPEVKAKSKESTEKAAEFWEEDIERLKELGQLQ